MIIIYSFIYDNKLGSRFWNYANANQKSIEAFRNCDFTKEGREVAAGIWNHAKTSRETWIKELAINFLQSIQDELPEHPQTNAMAAAAKIVNAIAHARALCPGLEAGYFIKIPGPTEACKEIKGRTLKVWADGTPLAVQYMKSVELASRFPSYCSEFVVRESCLPGIVVLNYS